MIRMTLVASRDSKVKAMGPCHQVRLGYEVVGLVLGLDLGFDLERPEDEWEFCTVYAPCAEQVHEMLDNKATFRPDFRRLV